MSATPLSNSSNPSPSVQPGKVGSSVEAAREPSAPLDFGIPARQADASTDPDGRAKGPEQGTGPMRSGAQGRRTTGVGVGAPGGSDGAGSGGDLDPDFIGLDGRGGLSNNPAERKTSGPDMLEPGRDAFASGPPATGKDAPVMPHGEGDRPGIDAVDHSGGDVTTSGDESDESANPEIEEIRQETDLERGTYEQSRTT